MGLGNAQRQLISRLAMAVVAAVLLGGGYAMVHVSRQLTRADATQAAMDHDWHRATHADDDPTISGIWGIGVGLTAFGVMFMLGAILPTRVLYRLPFFAEPDRGRADLEELVQ